MPPQHRTLLFRVPVSTAHFWPAFVKLLLPSASPAMALSWTRLLTCHSETLEAPSPSYPSPVLLWPCNCSTQGKHSFFFKDFDTKMSRCCPGEELGKKKPNKSEQNAHN